RGPRPGTWVGVSPDHLAGCSDESLPVGWGLRRTAGAPFSGTAIDDPPAGAPSPVDQPSRRRAAARWSAVPTVPRAAPTVPCAALAPHRVSRVSTHERRAAAQS